MCVAARCVIFTSEVLPLQTAYHVLVERMTVQPLALVTKVSMHVSQVTIAVQLVKQEQQLVHKLHKYMCGPHRWCISLKCRSCTSVGWRLVVEVHEQLRPCSSHCIPCRHRLMTKPTH